MPPRSRQPSKVSSHTNITGSQRTTSKKTPRISPDMSKMTSGPFSENMSSHFILSSPQDHTYSGSPSWHSDVSTGSSGNDIPGLDPMQLDDFNMGDNFMMPMMPMNECFDPVAVAAPYPAMNHVAMSQTLTGPYQDHLFENDLTAPISMTYNGYDQYPQATIRHGLPSPPADCYNDYSDELSLDSACDLNFSTLPGPSLDANMQYERISTISVSRQAQPRPIRSASERSVTEQSSVGSQDIQLGRDERADKVKARSDPRYDQKPDEAGYYRCPLANEEPCNHKPTKQKCIYAKYLDSHLKPYLCKHGSPGNDCENLRFSSNACLFRHEREAHGMHNHGMNPYLCLYPGCERARVDNGFPRRWNQRDHMKRVHDWVETDTDDITGDKYGPMDTSRRRRSGTSNGVQMKRSSSSQAKAHAANNTRTSRTSGGPRYEVHSEKQTVDCHAPGYLMTMGDAQYATFSQPTTSPHSYTASYGQLPY